MRCHLLTLCAAATTALACLGACAGAGGESRVGPSVLGATTPATAVAGAASPASSNAPAAETRGVRVSGNTLLLDGVPGRLLGASRSGTEYACLDRGAVFEPPSDDALARAMRAWRMNVVRVPLNEDCWLGINGAPAAASGDVYRAAIRGFVDALAHHGLYAILDLHWSAPGAVLARGQAPMADRDHAVDFWRSVASVFGGDPRVVFDLFNEPYVTDKTAANGDAWACWRSGCLVAPSGAITAPWQSAGMQELVDAVRGEGATNVLLAGGLDYANDLEAWLAHAPSDPRGQLAASFHVYDGNACADEACWDASVGAVAARVPVVTGELGEKDCAHGFIDRYMPWADARGVSYLGWAWNAWDCREGPALVKDWRGAPTAFGEGLKAHLAALATSAQTSR